MQISTARGGQLDNHYSLPDIAATRLWTGFLPCGKEYHGDRTLIGPKVQEAYTRILIDIYW